MADGVAPTVKQFDSAPAEAREGWNSSRVVRAWTRWRWAADAYVEEGKSATEVAAAATRRGRKSQYVDYLTGVKKWLDSDPPERRASDYSAWAERHNEERGPDELPVIESVAPIRAKLKTGWPEIKRLAAGEIESSDIPKRQPRQRERLNRTKYDLVTITDIQEMLGLPDHPTTQHALRRREGAPVAVVVRAAGRLWLRKDVDSFRQGRKPRRREENELGHLFYDAREVKERLGLTSSNSVYVQRNKRVPSVALKTGSMVLWLAAEIEAARDTTSLDDSKKSG